MCTRQQFEPCPELFRNLIAQANYNLCKNYFLRAKRKWKTHDANGKQIRLKDVFRGSRWPYRLGVKGRKRVKMFEVF